jgi:hypothetical protein
MNDDLTIRQAADTVYDLLRQFLQEPSEANRSTLISVMKHYTVQGYRFKLTQSAVIVTKPDAQRHLSGSRGSRGDAVSGGVNA